VVFGRVIEGYKVFQLIEQMACENERPLPTPTIIGAGIYKIAQAKAPKG
jgi:cyclophilin family peptidyl-prolyl cis-trans isomerase